MLPVDLSGGVALQFEAWVWRQELVQVDPIARLVIGPFNPITTELGQQNQGKLTLSAENLTETANKKNYCDGQSYKRKINSTEISTAKCFLPTLFYELVYLMDTGVRDVVFLGLSGDDIQNINNAVDLFGYNRPY